MARDDKKFIEDCSIMFAMYCDMNSMNVAEGIGLADKIADAIQGDAEWRDEPEN